VSVDVGHKMLTSVCRREQPVIADMPTWTGALFSSSWMSPRRHDQVQRTPSCSHNWGTAASLPHARTWSRCVRTSSRISRNGIGMLAWLRSLILGVPTVPQTILPRINFISSNEKARSVWERTLPREETLKESAVAASSSGPSQTAMTSYRPSVQ
jgi:hypothetical protein